MVNFFGKHQTNSCDGLGFSETKTDTHDVRTKTMLEIEILGYNLVYRHLKYKLGIPAKAITKIKNKVIEIIKQNMKKVGSAYAVITILNPIVRG